MFKLFKDDFDIQNFSLKNASNNFDGILANINRFNEPNCTSYKINVLEP